MFSQEGTTASTLTGSPSSAIAPERGEDGTSAAHVGLHLLHAVSRLQREPAGVERDRLADEPEDRPPPGSRTAGSRKE